MNRIIYLSSNLFNKTLQNSAKRIWKELNHGKCLSRISMTRMSGTHAETLMNDLPSSTNLSDSTQISDEKKIQETTDKRDSGNHDPEIEGDLEDMGDGSAGKKKKAWSKNARKRHQKRKEKRKADGELPEKKPRKKHDFYSEPDVFEETSYYFENGLRKVYPYYFKFSTFAKGRWYKRTLLDVFCHEFKHFPEKTFKEKISSGEVCVNGKVVDGEYKLKDNDFITHLSHRHEVPVTQEPIEIVHECDNLLVVNKPSSLPCHPCGSFRHNSLVYILWREHGYKGLKFIHRLDRLTSGLLIFAKNEEKAAELSRQVAGRQLRKEYVCRVEGEFPSEQMECREPLGILSFKLGIQKVCPSGKDAWTTFNRISTDGKESIVRCFPHTGRTHQIRVHLQYLGYPIVNDPLYNSDIWGPGKGKGADYGKSEDEVIALIMADHDKLKYVNVDIDSTSITSESATDSATSNLEGVSDCTEAKPPEVDAVQTVPGTTAEKTHAVEGTSVENTQLSSAGQSASSIEEVGTASDTVTDRHGSTSHPKFDPSRTTFDPTCLDCQRKFKDPAPEQLVMYLHARKYTGPDWEFETPLPPWTKENWNR